MKAYLRSILETSTPGGERLLVREALQAEILTALQRLGAMIPLAFHGGTALRFLYAIPRFSEDLDFALERMDRGYDFRAYLKAIRADLERQGYEIEIKLNDRKIVHKAFVRFPGLLFDLGLSPHRSEALAIKLEVDTRPPQGATLDTTLIRRHRTLQLQHHDRASLFAGKIHAVLQRSYTKGRDLYDLLWYLSDPKWPIPNLEMLNNALEQSAWSGPMVTPDTWPEVLETRLREIDWRPALSDVEPFLETTSEAHLLTVENLVDLVRRKRA